MYKTFKRLMDIIFSIILLPFVLIVIIISSIFIKIEDSGKIFYMAKRTGKDGKIFNMIKLRTMKENAPDIRMEDGSTYNSKDDDRVTKFGKIARKTSIDELPQIINVLIGDMSFIGPRPNNIDYINKYTDEEKISLTIRPGITGYNQAINRNSVGTKEKLKKDIYYVNNMSFLFDLRIILLTIKIVLLSKNVYREDK